MMSQFLETTVSQFKTSPIPSSTSEIPATDSLRVDAPVGGVPAMHAVADMAYEASPEIMSPTVDSSIAPALENTTSVDQAPALPSGGAFANDRMFVREYPW